MVSKPAGLLALDRNTEVGLLVERRQSLPQKRSEIRDYALALSVSSHFRALIDRRLLRPLPMA